MEDMQSERIEKVKELLAGMAGPELCEVRRFLDGLQAYGGLQAYAGRCIAVMSDLLGRDILERCRVREVVWGRFLVIYHLVMEGWSTVSVARVFGMDHSSIIHAKSAVDGMMDSPGMYRSEMMVWKIFIKRIKDERVYLEG